VNSRFTAVNSVCPNGTKNRRIKIERFLVPFGKIHGREYKIHDRE